MACVTPVLSLGEDYAVGNEDKLTLRLVTSPPLLPALQPLAIGKTVELATSPTRIYLRILRVQEYYVGGNTFHLVYFWRPRRLILLIPNPVVAEDRIWWPFCSADNPVCKSIPQRCRPPIPVTEKCHQPQCLSPAVGRVEVLRGVQLVWQGNLHKVPPPLLCP